MTIYTDYKTLDGDIVRQDLDWRLGWPVRYEIKSALWLIFGLSLGLAIGLLS